MLKLANLKIEVGTAEEYQGREVDAMIVSTVRANSQLLNFDARTGLGFVSQTKRTCVTLTRSDIVGFNLKTVFPIEF